jgi:hypothetical protein
VDAAHARLTPMPTGNDEMTSAYAKAFATAACLHILIVPPGRWLILVSDTNPATIFHNIAPAVLAAALRQRNTGAPRTGSISDCCQHQCRRKVASEQST